RDARRSFAFIL
ncbi:ABC transporter periplasmic oligopeptide binding lipocomponent domain protein, partial [Chlamydia psittaci 84-8471/1]